MGMKAYRFVGLNKDVWLPDDIKVVIDIVPASRTNIRSNQPFSGQTSYTQHETANFNAGADAWMHRNWLHSGAGGSSVAFNFVVDDGVIIQLTPLNEVTWAAGTPDGNRYSYHTELCVNAGIDHVKARRNAAALAGGILAAKGWESDRLLQHNVWYGKDCPYLLRREGRWAPFVAKALEFSKLAKSAASGGVAPVPTPTAAPFKIGTVVKLNANYNMRSAPDASASVITVLPAGTTATVTGGPVTNDGYVWWNLKSGSFNGHVAQEGLTKVSDPVPMPATPAVFDGTKDVVINGITFHADKRTITATATTNIRRYASTEQAPIGTLNAGQTKAVLGWVQGEEVNGIDKWWVIDGGRIWSGATK